MKPTTSSVVRSEVSTAIASSALRAPQNFAPVVQAQPNAPPHTLNDKFNKVAEGFGRELGKGVVQAIFGQQPG